MVWASIITHIGPRVREILKRLRDPNVIGVVALKTPKRIGQQCQLCGGPFTQFRQFLSRNEAAALCHHGMQERISCSGGLHRGHDIVITSSIAAVLSVDLFAARPGGFPFRSLPAGSARILLKFVGTIERRCIGRRGHGGADGKTVDRCSAGDQPLQLVFVQIAARQDLGLWQAPLIQDAPDFSRMVCQVAAI